MTTNVLCGTAVSTYVLDQMFSRACGKGWRARVSSPPLSKAWGVEDSQVENERKKGGICGRFRESFVWNDGWLGMAWYGIGLWGLEGG